MSKPSPKISLKTKDSPVQENTLEVRVLRFLKENGKSFLEAFFPKKYPAYSSLGRWMFGLDEKQKSLREIKEETILSALKRLAKKGLVEKVKKEKAKEWFLTEKGEYILDKLQNEEIKLPQEDGKVRIFVFDIPEKKRNLRDEIRINLVSFGYKMLQKSVWLGKRPLPLDFLEFLKDRGVFQNIHFFEVKEEGTLDDFE